MFWQTRIVSPFQIGLNLLTAVQAAQHTAAMHSVQQHGHQGTSCPCSAHLPLTCSTLRRSDLQKLSACRNHAAQLSSTKPAEGAKFIIPQMLIHQCTAHLFLMLSMHTTHLFACSCHSVPYSSFLPSCTLILRYFWTGKPENYNILLMKQTLEKHIFSELVHV